MKRILLAAVAAIAITGPANAQAIVHDPVSNLQRITEFGRSIAQQIQQYQMLKLQYESVVRTIGTGNVSGIMGQLGTGYLPGTSTIQGLMGGYGSHGVAGTYLQRDRLYAPPVRDEWAMEMERREQVTANARALAEDGLNETERELASLHALKAQVDSTTTVVDAQLLGVEMQGVQHRQALHAQRLGQINSMISMADRTDGLRQEQRLRRDADLYKESLGGVGGGTSMARTAPGNGFMGF